MGALISKLFFSFTSDSALEAAIYSFGLASNMGLHQIEEPTNLKAVAEEIKKSRA